MIYVCGSKNNTCDNILEDITRRESLECDDIIQQAVAAT